MKINKDDSGGFVMFVLKPETEEEMKILWDLGNIAKSKQTMTISLMHRGYGESSPEDYELIIA